MNNPLVNRSMSSPIRSVAVVCLAGSALLAFSIPASAQAGQVVPTTTVAPGHVAPALEAAIKIGGDPTSMVVTPNEKHAYVARHDMISVVDLVHHKVTGSIRLPNVTDMAISPNGRTLIATGYELSKPETYRLNIIDVHSNTLRGSITLPDVPNAVAMAPNGHVADVAMADSVAHVDLVQQQITDVIFTGQTGMFTDVVTLQDGNSVAAVESAPDGHSRLFMHNRDEQPVSIPLPRAYLTNLTVSPDDRMVYATGNTVETGQGIVMEIDTVDHRVITTATTEEQTHLGGVTFTQDAHHAFIAGGDTNYIFTLDFPAFTLRLRLGSEGNYPTDVQLSRNDSKLFVLDEAPGVLSIIDF